MEFQVCEHWHYRQKRVMQITQAAASMVDELVFSYGHLAEHDPEREILTRKISDVLSQWSTMVSACGARPMDLWSVSMATPEGNWEWQYPCSSFVEFRPQRQHYCR